jgi:hypothetical protein
MADISLTAANIRALVEYGAVVVPGTAGASLSIGQLVYEDSTNGWKAADADVSAAPARAQGMVVESYDGDSTIASGEAISVCLFGPVGGLSSLTAGSNYYISDTAGSISDDADTYDRIVGFGITIAGEVCLFLHFQQNDPSSS